MSTCIDDATIIRHASGELDPEVSSRLESHLQSCERCRLALQAQRETAALLDAWKVTLPADLDVREAVLTVAKQVSPAPNWRPMAAAILIAAGLGLAAGRLIPPRTSQHATLVEVTPDELMERIGLDSLPVESAALDQVFDDESLAEAGEQS